MPWYSHLFQNFPQFPVIHTVKGFGIVNKAEVDVFLELSCFFDDPANVGNLNSGSSAFSKTSMNIFPDVQAGLRKGRGTKKKKKEKAGEPEIKLPTFNESQKKQESSRKTSLSALLTMPKPLTVGITIHCGKF